MTKLILCDLDGTLLRSDKTISGKSAEALERCRAKGMLVGFSTSRGRANIVPWEAQIQPDVLICNGGASVFYRGELFCREQLLYGILSILLAYMIQFLYSLICIQW